MRQHRAGGAAGLLGQERWWRPRADCYILFWPGCCATAVPFSPIQCGTVGSVGLRGGLRPAYAQFYMLHLSSNEGSKLRRVLKAWGTLVYTSPPACLHPQFIYDTWYAALTPDKEFPADVRRLLNGAFGTLAARSRRLDLRGMLNDVSELFMEQVWRNAACLSLLLLLWCASLLFVCLGALLSFAPPPPSFPFFLYQQLLPTVPPHPPHPQLELFRDTRDSILAAHGPTALVDMTPAARERAFRQEMRAEKNLHPALQTPEGHYKVGGCFWVGGCYSWVFPCGWQTRYGLYRLCFFLQRM